MIDHILTFTDEPTAHTSLDPLGYGSNGTTWDTSRCNPNIQIITAEAVFNNGVLVTPATTKSGWWIMVSLAAIDPNLQALGAAIAFFNRDTGVRMWVTANALQAIALASMRIAPVFCGSTYSFGV